MVQSGCVRRLGEGRLCRGAAASTPHLNPTVWGIRPRRDCVLLGLAASSPGLCWIRLRRVAGWHRPFWQGKHVMPRGGDPPGTNLGIASGGFLIPPRTSLPPLPHLSLSPGAKAPGRLPAGLERAGPLGPQFKREPDPPGTVPVSSNQPFCFRIYFLRHQVAQMGQKHHKRRGLPGASSPLRCGVGAFHASACALIRHGITRKPLVGSRGPFELSALLLAGTEAPEAVSVSPWIRTVATSPREAKGVFSGTWNCLRCVGLQLVMPQQVAGEDGNCSLKCKVGLQLEQPGAPFPAGEWHPPPSAATCPSPPPRLFALTFRETKRLAGAPPTEEEGTPLGPGPGWLPSQLGSSQAASQHGASVNHILRKRKVLDKDCIGLFSA